MAYAQIEISEVGPAEYPLIKVLRDTIFGAYGHRFSTSFDEEIAGRQDVLALIAHLEGNPVGYKIGYRYKPGRYQSWTGGVLPDYRRSGVARRMQDWQHGWCRSRGYRFVQFSSFNKFREMLLFGLSSGFMPIGIDWRPENELSIKFQKDLTVVDPPRREKRPPLGDVHIESVGPNFHGLISRMCSSTMRTQEQIDRSLDGPDRLVLVAFAQGKPIGFVAGRGKDGRKKVFKSLLGAVLPEHRGRGVATALLSRQTGEAVALGYRTVRLNAPNDEAALISTCLKLGFGVTGMFHRARRRSLVVRMERELEGAD